MNKQLGKRKRSESPYKAEGKCFFALPTLCNFHTDFKYEEKMCSFTFMQLKLNIA